MAEQVQEAMDRMVAPLRDLHERHVFSEDEVSAIVNRRRESEYRLRRRGRVRQADFLAYIQAETQLEELRALRTKRLLKERRKQGGDFKFSASKLGDSHVKQHIVDIWTRTLRKFKEIPLWMEYFEFLKSIKSYGRLGSAYAQCLALFPKATEIWIQAASHAYFEEHSIHNARIMLQRAIRVNQGCPSLWREYFILELHFVAKLQGRLAILKGVDSNEDDVKARTALEAEQEALSASDPHKIAKIVLLNAFKEIKTVSFRLDCLAACDDFPGTESLVGCIQNNVETTCSNDPLAWSARAKWATEIAIHPPVKKQRRSEDGAVVILAKAIHEIPTPEMLLQTVEFLANFHDRLDRGSEYDELIKQVGEKSLELGAREVVLRLAQMQIDQGQAEEAAEYLNKFCDACPKNVNHDVWRQLASLSPHPLAVLEKGVESTLVDEPGYKILLLELLGCQLYSNDNCDIELLKKLLLLGPTTEPFEPAYELGSVTEACAAVLKLMQSQDTGRIRRAYETILFESSWGDCLEEDTIGAATDIIDTVLQFELGAAPGKQRERRLCRICDRALEIFRGTGIEAELRQRREEILYGEEKQVCGPLKTTGARIPSVDFSSDSYTAENFHRQFECFRLVHIKSVPKDSSRDLTWKTVGSMFDTLGPSDKASWCVERELDNSVGGDFLQPMLSKVRGYCSFLVQKDKKAFDDLVQRLPVEDLVISDWTYEPAIWIFFGRNPEGNSVLAGRPEHTDAVTHDGTWHFQLSGRKCWILKPTPSLLEHIWEHLPAAQRVSWSIDTKFVVECNESDILVIDTRLWLHSTMIPSQHVPSVSYARDFRANSSPKDQTIGGMENLDGLYAVTDIEVGTVIFTEKDMPDGELHRSRAKPNCEVVELEDGTSAVVSLSDIKAGAFFTVADSDCEGASDEEAD